MEKFILKSRTVQGLIVAAVPLVMELFGLSWTDDDTHAIETTVDVAIQFVGLLYALYGRLRAIHPITVKPKV